MKIEKGKQYECIKDMYIGSSVVTRFKKGKIYECTKDDFLVSEIGDKHGYSEGTVDNFFKLYTPDNRFKKGEKYKCTISRTLLFTKGKVYECTRDGFLRGDIGEEMSGIISSFKLIVSDKIKHAIFAPESKSKNKPIIVFNVQLPTYEYLNNFKKSLKDQGVYDHYFVVIKTREDDDDSSIVVINTDGSINKI